MAYNSNSTYPTTSYTFHNYTADNIHESSGGKPQNPPGTYVFVASPNTPQINAVRQQQQVQKPSNVQQLSVLKFVNYSTTIESSKNNDSMKPQGIRKKRREDIISPTTMRQITKKMSETRVRKAVKSPPALKQEMGKVVSAPRLTINDYRKSLYKLSIAFICN